MKLTLENFFSHLIFNPSDADTTEDKAIAWVATIACGIFSLGACHAICALRNYCFTHIPPEKATDQDQTISEVKDKALGTQPTKTIEVAIRPEVKITLDKLFEGSPYSIDDLPIYPLVTNVEKKILIDREKMTAPIMKGRHEDGRAFILIKIDHDYKHVYFQGREENETLESLLILFETKKNPLIWSGSQKILPPFLRAFTNADGLGPTERQEGNFKLVQTLLQTGESPDRKGNIWHIPGTIAKDPEFNNNII